MAKNFQLCCQIAFYVSRVRVTKEKYIFFRETFKNKLRILSKKFSEFLKFWIFSTISDFEQNFFDVLAKLFLAGLSKLLSPCPEERFEEKNQYLNETTILSFLTFSDYERILFKLLAIFFGIAIKRPSTCPEEFFEGKKLHWKKCFF